jgi:hypothetical protein
MKIVVEVPDATCMRCGKVEPLRPQALRAGGSEAMDDAGGGWTLQSTQRPPGWTAGPNSGSSLQRGLCAECSAGLVRTTEEFMQALAPPPEPGPPVANARPTPIRYLERPPTNAIPIAAPIGPRREAISTVYRPAPQTVMPTPPPAPSNTRTVLSNAQMAVNTSKVSSNVVRAPQMERPPQPNMLQRGLAQVAPSAAPPVRAELAQQPPPVVEVGEAAPIPSPHVPENTKIVSRS